MSPSSTPSSAPSPAGRPAPREKALDPIVRNALRYTLSPREYQLLHQHLLSRAPAIRTRTPPPNKYAATVQARDDYNAAAVRAGLRFAVLAFSTLKAWDLVKARFLARGAPSR
jgi:hypothetical protein